MKNLTEKEITERWTSTGLLEGITKEHLETCALILQAQMVVNEEISDGHQATAKRLSIPMVRRVLPYLLENKKKVKPIFEGEGQWISLNVDHSIFDCQGSNYNLNYEAEQCALMSMQIAEQLCKLPGEEIGFGGFRCIGHLQAYISS